MADLGGDGNDADRGTDETAPGDLAAAVTQHNDQWHAPDRAWTPASLLARLGAAAIDVVLFVAVAVVLAIGLALLSDFDGPPLRAARGGWVYLLVFDALTCLYLAADTCGRTLGKALLGLYPMSEKATRSRRPLLVRWALRCLPLFVAMGVAGGALIHNLAQDYYTFTGSALDGSMSSHPPLTLVAMLVLLVVPAGAAGQSWYDRVARTGVMRPASGAAKVRGFEPILPPPPPPQ